MHQLNHIFLVRPTLPTVSPRQYATSAARPATASSEHRTASIQSSATRRQRRTSPPALFFPVEVGPPKRPKPMPKIPRQSSTHSHSTFLNRPSTVPEPIFIDISQPPDPEPLLSIMSRDIEEQFPLHPRRTGAPPRALPAISHPIASPASPLPHPPRTPESEDDSSTSGSSRQHQKKMNKVRRILGESVSAEVVFPSLPWVEIEAAIGEGAGRRASITAGAPSGLASLSSTNFTTGSTSHIARSFPTNPPHTGTSRRTFSVSSRSNPDSSPVPSSSIFAHSNQSFRSSSPGQRPVFKVMLDGKDHKSSRYRWMKTALNTLKGKSPKPTAPFNTITEPTALPLHSEHEFSDIPPSVNERASKPVTRTRDEKTQGWMGEWNQEDMADVIRKLRALK